LNSESGFESMLQVATTAVQVVCGLYGRANEPAGCRAVAVVP
jgi:hypothetical protein